ncbi:MAG: WbqC family protein [Paludibacteraceae bacterium]|nr:WbqC family protein [Paludibacteraceae bacterium]
MEAVFPLAYLGPVSYYAAMLSSEKVLLEQYEHYLKQTYRTRCKIATSNGILDLTVPVEKPYNKCAMKDIRIAYKENWQHIHWGALESAYRSSPFFDYYRDDFEPFYTRQIDFLLDFDLGLHEVVASLIGKLPKVELTQEYIPDYQTGALDFRSAFSPKELSSYKGKTYYQVFDQKFGFQNDLSIVDLLFNMGPESILVLRP